VKGKKFKRQGGERAEEGSGRGAGGKWEGAGRPAAAVMGTAAAEGGEARGGAGWGARAGRVIGKRPGAVMLVFTIVAATLGAAGMGVAPLLSPPQ